MIGRKMEPSANGRSDDPLGIAPPTPLLVHSETENKGTNTTALLGSRPSTHQGEAWEFYFSDPLDIPIQNTIMETSSQYWMTSPAVQPSWLPPDQDLLGYPTQVPTWEDAGPSIVGAENDEMTRPSAGSPPVETESVGSKRKRVTTPKERGKVRATRQKLPRLNPQGPTQVSIVQFVHTQMWPVITVALDESSYYPARTPRSPHGGTDHIPTRNPRTPAKPETGPTAPTGRKIHVDDPRVLLQTLADTGRFGPNHPHRCTYEILRYPTFSGILYACVSVDHPARIDGPVGLPSLSVHNTE